MVHIDYVTDLLEDEGCSIVIMVIDRLPKMFSFVPLSSNTAASVSTAFFKEVVVHNGLPRQIISNHNP